MPCRVLFSCRSNNNATLFPYVNKSRTFSLSAPWILSSMPWFVSFASPSPSSTIFWGSWLLLFWLTVFFLLVVFVALMFFFSRSFSLSAPESSLVETVSASFVAVSSLISSTLFSSSSFSSTSSLLLFSFLLLLLFPQPRKTRKSPPPCFFFISLPSSAFAGVFSSACSFSCSLRSTASFKKSDCFRLSVVAECFPLRFFFIFSSLNSCSCRAMSFFQKLNFVSASALAAATLASS
mmetsp:Transcript_11223/g.23788  ORF Transcript_11223/g.23788 Transcript_11223/m.23788 type:complete len:236 (-) Transcript_11223:915-1622(-)